jgi:hypothetical protein
MSGRGSGRKEYGICNPKISGKGKKDMPEMWFQDSNFCGLRLVTGRMKKRKGMVFLWISSSFQCPKTRPEGDWKVRSI